MNEAFECTFVEPPPMDDQWTTITDALRSGDSDRVNDAIDRIGELDREERLRLFDERFDDLTDLYAESEDGYGRQSVVRAVDEFMTLLSATASMADRIDDDVASSADLERRLDTATGFLIEALQDEDGRVRQSAVRAIKDAYRGYDGLGDTETIEALIAELEALADEYDDDREKHLLESKEDAAFFLQPPGTRLVQGIRRLKDRSDEE